MTQWGVKKKIGKDIIKKEADYILMVKDNQKELKQQVKKMFQISKISDTHTQLDAGHGKVETRKCDIICDLNFIDDKQEWPGLNRIVRVQSERYDKQTSKSSIQFRYYISSSRYNAEQINNSVRQHWSIENNLHWSLDVIFKEDESLKKKGHSPKNYNIILKMALAMIDKEKSSKASKPVKKLNAAWDDKYRSKIFKC